MIDMLLPMVEKAQTSVLPLDPTFTLKQNWHLKDQGVVNLIDGSVITLNILHLSHKAFLFLVSGYAIHRSTCFHHTIGSACINRCRLLRRHWASPHVAL